MTSPVSYELTGHDHSHGHGHGHGHGPEEAA